MLTANLFELWDAFRYARARRRALFQLEALDDRLLSDIGLHRGEIHAAIESALQAPSAERRSAACRTPISDPCAILRETP